ncbi:MAG: ThiF family adenylyltransferase [Bacillota bacterium]
MSQRLINRSPDLKRLRDEGYDIEVKSGYLLVKNVPYLGHDRKVKLGILVSDLVLAGDVTARPTNRHVAYFCGECPCDKNGSELDKIKNSSGKMQLTNGISIDHTFSSKPSQGYKDYHEKMTTYIAIISSPAQFVDPSATPRIFPVIETVEGESVFTYEDTASSRAGIGVANSKLENCKTAIIGVGGTGSYVLDLISKTPVPEIHIFDHDKFSQHNAFRTPGAASIEELNSMPQKAAYLAQEYSKMHRKIVAHNVYIDSTNTHLLKDMSFVFICIDGGAPRKPIVEYLESANIPFIDVGMGLQSVDNSLDGILRMTTSTPEMRGHVRAKARIPFTDAGGENAYDWNIQVAELNALSAALAVIRWKKLLGFYVDLEREHFSAYTIDGNSLLNEDRQ